VPEKILLVDDDMDTLRLVGLMLQRQGYEVRVASSGQQALGMVQAETPDLILLDIMMPEMDGYEVARRLRSDLATSEIPIIMFTAKTQVDDKVMGFEAGADDYLTKPTQPRELFAHMKAVLARSGKSRTSSFASSGEPGYMIGVLAAKGGLGISTLVLNLGITLLETIKKDVLVADFRPGQGTIGLELGLTETDGFNRLLKRKPAEITRREVEAEIISHPSGLRLLLSSPRPADARLQNAVASFENICQQLPLLSHYVVVDLGPSLSPITSKVIKSFNELVIVVEPIPNTIQQTTTLLNDLSEAGLTETKITIVLVNRTRSGVHLSWSQVQEQLGRSISVIFTPAPELAYQATISNKPLVKQQVDSLSSQQFAKLAERIAKHTH
jgi:CheY-like chemotaxis protein